MGNPYDCSVCHNDGFDHAPDCPFNPANMPSEEAPPLPGRPVERTRGHEEDERE